METRRYGLADCGYWPARGTSDPDLYGLRWGLWWKRLSYCAHPRPVIYIGRNSLYPGSKDVIAILRSALFAKKPSKSGIDASNT